MSTEEQEARLGHALRVRRDKREELRHINDKIDKRASETASLAQHIQQRVFKPDFDHYYYPTQEDLAALFEERTKLMQEIEQAEATPHGYLD